MDFLKKLHRSYKQVVLYFGDFISDKWTVHHYWLRGSIFVLVGSAISNAKQKLEGYTGTVLFVSCHLVEKKLAGSLWVPG